MTHEPKPSGARKGLAAQLKDAVKTNLAAGVLVLAPIGATVVFLRFVVTQVDQVILLLPEPYRPEHYLPFPVPGLGLVVVFMVLFLAGFLARNFLGRWVVAAWERLLSAIPFVSPFYKAVKQLVETVFSSAGKDFQRVVLMEYPRKGMFAIGFVTGVAVGEIQHRTAKRVVNVFLPTTPNPTSGFYLAVPEEEVVPLSMSVEDAFKVIVSGGIINPEFKPGQGLNPAPAAGGPGAPQGASHRDEKHS
ncbi:MAG: DUF502 domain-containing protein [Thermodesulfobacteriota bacterium]